MTYAFYHSKDLDGWCCGYLFKVFLDNPTLIGWDYGDPLPDVLDNITDRDSVFIADISFPPDKLALICSKAGQVVWIDHHISAIKAWEEYLQRNKIDDLQTRLKIDYLQTRLDTEHAACELVFSFFNKGIFPAYISLLGSYDIFRGQGTDLWNEKILPYQYGMRLDVNSVDSLEQALKRPTMETIEIGKSILKYQKTKNETAGLRAFEVNFKGLRAICLNTVEFNSQAFESIYNPLKHELMIPFAYDGKTKKWKYSLYTTHDLDCSLIAKSMGGGGHKKAAGFESEEQILFKYNSF